ncbi:MAG: hypothetical protein EHM35_11410 [Planctomycetaceae bacterium]|nr:MAG: hypothetical protein EHM35_11410 [Planctomycetaceae bacterium]
MTPRRQIVRAAKGARGAAYLGAKAAAGGAAVELYNAAWDVRIKAKAILAAQAAKQVFTPDLRTLDRLLEEHDSFVQEMQSRPGQQRVRRYTKRYFRNLLSVEAARSLHINDVFLRYGFELKRAGRDFVTRCPFHDAVPT